MARRRFRPRTAHLALVALAAGMFSTTSHTAPADAKTSYSSGYGYERTWNAALRLVRVDLGLKVTEKDDKSGYLLFEYTSSESGKHAVPGSIELIRGDGERGPVRVVVQIPKMPRYHEQVMADELGRKLRSEYGEPLEPPKKEKKKEKRHDDDDDNDDDKAQRGDDGDAGAPKQEPRDGDRHESRHRRR